MNPHLKQVNKIEFVVTNQCTGRCKHCSQGERSPIGVRIDPRLAAEAVARIAREYAIQTVMTFGGEPLLHPEAVYAIMASAREAGVPKRQVITNGYFATDADTVYRAARRLRELEVNDLLLSVDAFHQETIPPKAVKVFAAAARDCGLPVRIQPAWLVSRDHDNPYNAMTKRLVEEFCAMGFAEGTGNVVFPEGNALTYLGAYFADGVPENPYVEDPFDVRCISIDANGDVLGGNLYTCDVMEILEKYAPKEGR